MALLMKIKIT